MKRRDPARNPKKVGQSTERQNKPTDHPDQPAAHQQPERATLNSMAAAPPSADEYHRAHERSFWDRQIRAALWLNGITIGSAFVALLGLIALFLSILDANDSTVQANRAWLSPAFMVLNTPLENSSIVGFQLHVEDTGREPANNVVYRFHHFMVPYIAQGVGKDSTAKNETCEGLNPSKDSGFTIYPSSVKFWIPYAFEDRPMIADILARKGSLVIEGCVAFNTFGKRHTSGFRFFLRDVPGQSCWASNEGITTPKGTITCWNFNGMLNGNYAD